MPLPEAMTFQKFPNFFTGFSWVENDKLQHSAAFTWMQRSLI